MNTVLVLLVSVTVCWHLVLCTSDQGSSASLNNEHVGGRSEESYRQQKDIAALFTATRDFISVMKRISIDRGISSIVEGRGTHGLMKIAVPLIAGFKAAAVVVSSLVVLKGLLMKSLAFSTLALSVSMGIAFKYLYDKIQGPLGHGGAGYDAYNSYSPSWSGGSDQVWQGSSAVELQPGIQGAIQGGHEAYPLTGTADLQGHFSEHIQKIANTSRLPFGEQSAYTGQTAYSGHTAYTGQQAAYSGQQTAYPGQQTAYTGQQTAYTGSSSSQVSAPYQQPTQYTHTAAQYPMPHGQRNL